MASITPHLDRINAVFGQSLTITQAGGVRLGGLSTPVTVYTWPEGGSPYASLDNDQKLTVMMALTLPGRSTSDSPTQWQSFVLTWSVLALDAYRLELSKPEHRGYILAPLPDTFIQDVLVARTALETDAAGEHQLHFPPALPDSAHPYTARVDNCGTLVGMYSYYAIILILMGKNIDPSNRDPITIKRPGNLIDMFKAPDVAYILTGMGRIGNVGHGMVSTAWQYAASPRRALIALLSQSRGADDVATRACSYALSMLEFAGMQPAALIHELLVACPWIVDEVPTVRPAYDLYRQSVEAYAQQPVHLRPFIKIMYGDTTRIFHSKSLVDLTQCAVEFKRITQDSIEDYQAPGSARSLADFAAACARHGVVLKGTTALPPPTGV